MGVHITGSARITTEDALAYFEIVEEHEQVNPLEHNVGLQLRAVHECCRFPDQVSRWPRPQVELSRGRIGAEESPQTDHAGGHGSGNYFVHGCG